MSSKFDKIPLKNYSLILPQTFDDSITFYEYMNKLLYAFEHAASLSFDLDAAYDAENKNLTLSLTPIEKEA